MLKDMQRMTSVWQSIILTGSPMSRFQMRTCTGRGARLHFGHPKIYFGAETARSAPPELLAHPSGAAAFAKPPQPQPAGTRHRAHGHLATTKGGFWTPGSSSGCSQVLPTGATASYVVWGSPYSRSPR